MPFVHLHVHDIYSFGKGIGAPKDFVKEAKRLGQNALAITNIGNISGSYEFYKACNEGGIKPILGQEFYVAENDDMTLRDSSNQRMLVLLAQTQEGWHNLCKLSSLSYMKGRYYVPRIDSKVLARHSQGLIGLSSGIDGVVGTHWAIGEEKKALQTARKYNTILKGNFYLELIPVYSRQQIDFNQFLIEVAKLEKIKTVASNCCYYVLESQAKYHPYLIMIKNNLKVSEFEGQMSDQLYLKSKEEMYDAFERQGLEKKQIESMLGMTQQIADSVQEVKFETTFKLPVFMDFKTVNPEDLEKKDANESDLRTPSLFD